MDEVLRKQLKSAFTDEEIDLALKDGLEDVIQEGVGYEYIVLFIQWRLIRNGKSYHMGTRLY